ncbi:MAG: hypothetical protein HC879_11900 [Leptolyngbyaceae cyanobacterium SL_5_9]|nr:hypothetical protein [Leptolyngbyaceae cyanobacterium SL_5_9]
MTQMDRTTHSPEQQPSEAPQQRPPRSQPNRFHLALPLYFWLELLR